MAKRFPRAILSRVRLFRRIVRSYCIFQPMGLSYSSFAAKSTGKPSTLLPLVGNGQYEVGCVDVMIKGDDGTDCGFFARLFYPSTLKSDGLEYPVWRPRNEYIVGLAEYRQITPLKISFFLDWIIGERRVPAAWHASLFHHSKEDTSENKENVDTPTVGVENSVKPLTDPNFPVIIFSHGISGNRLCYSTFCASLASYGFVVAALEHRDRSSSWSYYLELDSTTGEMVEKPVSMATFPDGEEEFKERNEQINYRVAESVKCLQFLKELNLGKHINSELNAKSKIVYGQEFDWSQFRGRLDTSNAGIVGHSFGGATAIAAALHLSAGFKISVVLDGWLYPLSSDVYEKADQPILFLNASRWQWHENVRRMKRLESSGSPKVLFTLKDIVHHTFSDFGYLSPGYVGRHFGLQGDLDPSYTGKAILDIVVSFLNYYFTVGEKNIHDTLSPLLKDYEGFILEGTDLDLSQALPEGDVTPAIIDGGGNLFDDTEHSKDDGKEEKFGCSERHYGPICLPI